MSKFYLGDSTSSPPSSARSSLDEPGDDLPYPIPLTRSDFLAPSFDPLAYLSTLRNRHQTLEDLRADLRSRSQLLNQELLELVNGNYQEFLGLASSLKGGDEKVEEARLGLMGFKREVEGLSNNVAARESEAKGLVQERKEVVRQIGVGRRLLEIETRMGELERRLMVGFAGEDVRGDGGRTSDEETDSADDDAALSDGGAGIRLARLQRDIQQYLIVKQMSNHVGEQHPFLHSQLPRTARLRNTLLLDLRTAMKQAKNKNSVDSTSVMKIMNMYRQMDETKEAIEAIKHLKPR